MSDRKDIGQLISDQLDRLLAAEVTVETRKAVEAGQLDTRLWSACRELGLLGSLVAERFGGAGLGWSDLSGALMMLGKHAAPVPLGETIVAARLLSDAGLEPPEGSIATALDPLTLDESGTVNGLAKNVAWASMSPYILLLASQETVTHLCLMRADDLMLSPVDTFSREPSADVRCEGAQPIAVAPLDQSFTHVTLLAHFAVLRSAQIAGALGHMLPLCVEYANDRVQFGRPIAKFQAIQHALAQLASEVAASQASAGFACRKADSHEIEYGAMVGMSRAGRAATFGAEIAHQVFGAIGFTDEHSLHYYTRRLWQWRASAMSEQWWSEKLGEKTISAGGDALWPRITAA